MLSRQLAGARMGSAVAYHPSDVRAGAHEVGEPVAERGRLSRGVVAADFKAHPQVARLVAAEHRLHTSVRGGVSLATCEELAALVR